jgi:hypothetical protein
MIIISIKSSSDIFQVLALLHKTLEIALLQTKTHISDSANVTGGKPIAVLLQSISGVSAINPLVAF